ncbi:MAG: prolyl oligopeptidase family serine peptidase [Actinomycetia bacterium]|nr:prolyl oligopeptidase family serine peptidase [Actinomycetes bacterium]
MAILTLGAYGGATPPTGVTNKEWTVDMDGNTDSAGIVSYPTGLAAAGHGILFVRGGTTGAAASLADTDIDVLEDLVEYQSTAYGDPAGGRTIFAPAIRGCAADVWTDGPASPGTDEFGGDDLQDLALSWGIMDEIGVAAGTPAIHTGKKGALAFSAGAMRLLKALRARTFQPRAVCLRSPLTNIAYPGHVTSDAVRAMIPGWTSPSGTEHQDLTTYEKAQKVARSALHWCEDLPYIPYLIIQAEDDATIRAEDTRAFVKYMKDLGHDIDLANVPTAGHSFASASLVKASNNLIRGFFNRTLEV